jgi:hypothetical protein
MRFPPLHSLLLSLIPAASGLTQEPPSGWERSIQANGTLLFGNTEQRILGSRASLTRTDSRAEVALDLQNVYGETKDAEGRRAVTKRLWLGSVTADLNPAATTSPFVFVTAESNLEKRIGERYSTGAGAKRTFIRDERRELSLSMALLEERTVPLGGGAASIAASRVTRWSARGRVRQRWDDRVRFSHVTFWQPSVGSLASFLVRSSTELEYLLNEAVAVTTTFIDHYDSEAVRRGARTYNDGQLVFGVRASW